MATSALGREQLNEIAGWVLDKRLTSSVPDDDLTAECATRGFEPCDRSRKVLDFDLDPVPATWSRPLAVPRSMSPTTCTWAIEEQAQVTSGQSSEAGSSLKIDEKSKFRRVKGHSGLDVINDISNADSHLCLPFPSSAQ
jgi:hypothetical protein